MSKKPDDAAKVAGLASILKLGNQQKDDAPSPAPPASAAEVPAAAPRAAARTSKKERVGKYRDPAYHHYGLYLRKDTHKRVKRRLEDTESELDLSELLQMLLEQWLAAK